jgi:acetyl esterase/lipase
MKPLRFVRVLLASSIGLLASLSVPHAAEPPAKPKAKAAETAPPARVPEGVEVIHDVEIGKGGDRTLHAEIARPKAPSQSPLPAVIWIHGGGWSGGSHKGNRALPLATKGYFTASIEYRLSGEAKWPAQIEDCKLAVRWLRANAKKYNVDPDRIGCWGSSAGGHLVACLGTMGDQTQLEGTGGYPRVSSRVQAVVDYCGPADMTQGSAGIQGARGDNDAAAPLGLFGAPFKEKPELWKQGSPIRYVKPDAAPFLIVHGDKDTTVPIAHSEKLADALKKAGVSVELITVKGGGHGMTAPAGEPPAEPDRNALDAAVLAFFDKHLKK